MATVPCCGICSNQASSTRKLLCPSCATTSSLGLRIRLVNSLSEVASLTSSIDGLLGGEYVYDQSVTSDKTRDSMSLNVSLESTNLASRKYTGLLETKIKNLKTHLDNLKAATSKCREQTIALRESTQQLKTKNKDKENEVRKLRGSMYQIYDKSAKSLAMSISDALLNANQNLVPQITAMKEKHARDLALLVNIKRRRRKRDRAVLRPKVTNGGEDLTQAALPSLSPVADSTPPDVLVSFTVIPDLSILPHYSQPTINASLERLSYLIALLGYYLDVRLPYDISLPNKYHSYLRVSNHSGSIKHNLFLTTGIQSIAQHRPKDFELFAEAMAMLALDLAAVADKLGLQRTTLRQICQLNITCALIYSRLVPGKESDAIKDLIQQQNGEQPTVTEDLDLSSVTDFIINQVYFEINGASGEWNIVDRVESEGEADADTVGELTADKADRS